MKAFVSIALRMTLFFGEDISCKHAKAVKHGNHLLPSSKLGEIDDVANWVSSRCLQHTAQQSKIIK